MKITIEKLCIVENRIEMLYKIEKDLLNEELKK
jgi:hypothetical protein